MRYLKKTLRQFETAVYDASHKIKCGRLSHTDAIQVYAKISDEVNSKTYQGNRRYTIYTVGYVSGLIAAAYNLHWQDVEFCYRDENGVIYSTHRKTDKRTTEEFYSTGRGHLLGDMEGAHLWKGSDKVYSPWSYSTGRKG